MASKIYYTVHMKDIERYLWCDCYLFLVQYPIQFAWTTKANSGFSLNVKMSSSNMQYLPLLLPYIKNMLKTVIDWTETGPQLVAGGLSLHNSMCWMIPTLLETL